MIGGEPSDIRRLATQASVAADDVRRRHRDLVRAMTDEWSGEAGARYQQLLGRRMDDLSRVAESFDEVTNDLHQVASALESRQATVLAAFEAAQRQFDAAVDLVEDGAGAVADGAQQAWGYAEDVGGFVRDHAWPW